jgi:hypothetical protein
VPLGGLPPYPPYPPSPELAVGVGDALPVPVPVSVGVGVVGVGVGVGDVVVGVGVGVGDVVVGVGLGDVVVGVGVPDTVADGVGLALGDAEAEAAHDGDGVTDGAAVGMRFPVVSGAVEAVELGAPAAALAAARAEWAE